MGTATKKVRIGIRVLHGKFEWAQLYVRNYFLSDFYFLACGAFADCSGGDVMFCGE